MNIYKNRKSADDLWNIIGSFGEFDASVKFEDGLFCAENESIAVKSEIVKYDNGVCVRKGTVKNISKEDVSLNTFSLKFTLDGGEYDVYSQASFWQSESEGCWNTLNTTVSAYSKSVRNTCGATPFMVLWSNQQNRGTAFHLKTYSAWEMHITRKFCPSENTIIEVEMGVLKDDFDLKLKSGEEVELPEVIYYDVLNKVDFDCWKLHSYLNKKYPRKTLPVIYNSWLYKFDRFTAEDIIKQIEKAKELGVEYFVIDAGWFGDGPDWWQGRGDWEENQTFGFKGRMCEVAEIVRENGMKFGFWLEAECATETAKIVKEHPEYFLRGKESLFIDFANKEAREYLYNKTCQLVDRFGAEFIKFDFNSDLFYDKYRSAFTEYFKGHCEYIKKLKAKYPDMYIENCASGGTRMSIRDGELYDGFWPTDNQSPYYSLRIFKDTILRLAPQWMEGWITVRSAEKFSYLYGTDDMADKLFATNDGTWSNIISVEPDYLFGFMKGRAIALSFDLTSLSDDVFEKMKNYISDFKKEREFWKNSVCHILADTETMLVLEFRDEDSQKLEVVAFSGKSKQDNICVYPVVDADCEYSIDEETTLSGREIMENGVNIPINMPRTAKILKLNKTGEKR